MGKKKKGKSGNETPVVGSGISTTIGGEEFHFVEFCKHTETDELVTESLQLLHVCDDGQSIRKIAEFLPIPEQDKQYGVVEGRIYHSSRYPDVYIGSYVQRLDADYVKSLEGEKPKKPRKPTKAEEKAFERLLEAIDDEEVNMVNLSDNLFFAEGA